MNLSDGRRTLNIPSQYVISRSHFHWIDKAEGLDRSSKAASVSIPTDVLGIYLQGQNQLIGTITLISEQDKVAAVKMSESEIERINKNADDGLSTGLVINKGGYYWIYEFPGGPAFTVLSRSPKAATAADIVGYCSELGTDLNEEMLRRCLVKTSACGVAFEYYLPPSELLKTIRINQSFSKLVREWGVKDAC